MRLLLYSLLPCIVCACRHSIEDLDLKLTVYEIELLVVNAVVTLFLVFIVPRVMAQRHLLKHLITERKKRQDSMVKLQKYIRFQPTVPLSHLRRYFEDRDAAKNVEPVINYLP
ncbi:unnamed protein product [Bursaphelenchus okinawaensis]|uniref:Uncharacterized protein n=1 Tax=Bursaphelenchus okinawaensis TaxID=465554 RepID=A0A811LP27_9BILA|nr:unnamed protein product [Bursaphelenchus okinawaensis]CAG9125972.1 unnamed protein product [Bursaphelenchus okinawaensis]